MWLRLSERRVERRWVEQVTQPSTNFVSVALSPTYAQDQTVLATTYLDGVSLSRDGGRTWTPINEGLALLHFWTRADDYFTRMMGTTFSPRSHFALAAGANASGAPGSNGPGATLNSRALSSGSSG